MFGLSLGDLLYVDFSNNENPLAVHLRDSNGFQAFISGIVGAANMDSVNVIAGEGIELDLGDEQKKISLAVSINSSGTLKLWNITTGQSMSTTSTFQFLHLADPKNSFLDGKLAKMKIIK